MTAIVDGFRILKSLFQMRYYLSSVSVANSYSHGDRELEKGTA